MKKSFKRALLATSLLTFSLALGNSFSEACEPAAQEAETKEDSLMRMYREGLISLEQLKEALGLDSAAAEVEEWTEYWVYDVPHFDYGGCPCCEDHFKKLREEAEEEAEMKAQWTAEQKQESVVEMPTQIDKVEAVVKPQPKTVKVKAKTIKQKIKKAKAKQKKAKLKAKRKK